MMIASVLLAVVSGVTRKLAPKNLMPYLLVPADLAILFYVSKPLCAFYIVYTLVTFGFVKLLGKAKHKRFFFVFLSLCCTIPFFYTRAAEFFDAVPMFFAIVGISYNMLKAVDALYYTYYTELDVPFLTYANYMLFFPVLTSGPIFRYRDFEKTFNDPLPITSKLCEDCAKRLIRGMFKKMVALYFVTQLLKHMLGAEMHWYISLSIIALSYITLFLDLSGYSDIAIAIGRITGIDVPENFKKPWLSPSFTVFWRNWHVTLSDWIREHIYVVISGKKLNKYCSAAIGFVTMVVMALWHGFSLPFIVSGVYNGLLLAFENITGLTRSDRKKTLKKKIAFYVRCVAVSFLFGINSMIFIMSFDQIFAVLRGLFRL